MRYNYEPFRSRLALIKQHAERAATRPSSLFHQLIWSPTCPTPLDRQQWEAFQQANTQVDGEWQMWELFPDNLLLGRYLGNAEYLRTFRQLANNAMATLVKLQTEIGAGFTLPEGGLLKLPTNPGHLGVLELIYDTARCYATDSLRAEPGRWNLSGQVTLTEAENDMWSMAGDDTRFPTHPCYESLKENVFQSLAESIRYWIDPSAAETTGDKINDAPIMFPALAGVAHLPGGSGVNDRPLPFYDADLRQLRVGATIIKEFRQPAKNQERILLTFQEENWSRKVDDPLPPILSEDERSDPKKRLRDCIDALNDNHVGPRMIYFKPDGTGEGVVWYRCDEL